jgi:hypothetical protein
VDNAFWRISNYQRAQALADRIGSRRSPRLLNRLASRVNPYLPLSKEANFGGYYWVADQAEISTDIVFRPGRLWKRSFPPPSGTLLLPSRPKISCASWGASLPLPWPPR